MKSSDFDKFALVWRATSEYYNQPVTDGALALSFKNLEHHGLADIEHAINAHIRDTENGRFAPKVADIIRHIEKHHPDGRVSADEAWALAMQSFDEWSTVIFNDEISGALGSAKYIFDSGDKVGARMAFKAAYDRLVDKARADGRPVKWWPSFGFDPEGRAPAIQAAIEKNQLSNQAKELVGIPYQPNDELIEILNDAMPKSEDAA